MPDALIVSHLPYGPTAYFTLSNCVLRHDIAECKPASQAYPHLIIDGLNSKIGKRIGRILQSLFPIPRAESKRVLTFANRNDFIFFRHHMYTKEAGKVVLSEAGPRFEMQPYEGVFNSISSLFTLSLYSLATCFFSSHFIVWFFIHLICSLSSYCLTLLQVHFTICFLPPF